jgi:predicted acylesterase/phospholipase RssA
MGPPPPFTDEEILGGATRRLLDGVDFKFLFDSWEKKLDDKLARMLAEGERFRHVLALVERGGWFAADRFLLWLRTKLDAGSRKGTPRQFSGMTLAQFFAATGVEFSAVAADTTDGKLLVLNHRTAPECPIVWATRMSMSIPLVWDEVLWQPTWGTYLGREVAGHGIVDGGILSNFPLELFISDAPQVVKLMGPKKDSPTLGMLIDERLPVPAPRSKGVFVSVNIKPGELATVRRLQRLVDTATTAHDKMVIEEYSHLVVRLPAAGYGTTEFDMSDERREALVDAGRSAMALYLDTPPARARPTTGAAKGLRGRGPTPADRIAVNLLE